MKHAMISLHVFVSVPDEITAGALSKDIREAAERITADYHVSSLKSAAQCEDESPYIARERVRAAEARDLSAALKS